MRLHRFYVSQPLGEEVVIDDVSLVSQWSKVFRYNTDDSVILFNGDGLDVEYSIETISKSSCTLTRTKSSPSYIPRRTTTLYLSLLKKDNFELVVQKGTELGVTRFVPIMVERSEKKNLSYERLKKIAIEASEQSGRGDIPTIEEIQPLHHALSGLSTSTHIALLHIGGIPLMENISTFHNEKDVSLFVGPEGGFGEGDLELFKEVSFTQYSLGHTVLRAETAAFSACAFLNLLP